jgi:nucleoside-diphosphate-sugar epimerase
MRVLITGGAGFIGKATARYLIECGYEVHSVDLAAETDLAHVSYAVCNVTDYTQVFDQMRGCAAVVHMAALRSPFHAPGHEVYHINTLGTFNVFEAAAQHGIKRVVQASSINAIGCFWSLGDFIPQYLPVDEDHPTYTNDPYSFSKQQAEEIGAYFWRRDRISSAALRFPSVYTASYTQSPAFYEWRNTLRDFIDAWLNLPQSERQQQLAHIREVCFAYRAARSMEYPHTTMALNMLDGVESLLWRTYNEDRYNLWAAVDERDAAQAIERALAASFDGSHPLFINDDYNTLNYDAETLARVFYPQTQARKRELNGAAAFVSIQRARELIGFSPRYPLHGDMQNND